MSVCAIVIFFIPAPSPPYPYRLTLTDLVPSWAQVSSDLLAMPGGDCV